MNADSDLPARAPPPRGYRVLAVRPEIAEPVTPQEREQVRRLVAQIVLRELRPHHRPPGAPGADLTP